MEEFKVQTYRSIETLCYVVARIIAKDKDGKPTRASFESGDIQLPAGGKVQYPKELQTILAHIQETKKLITQTSSVIS